MNPTDMWREACPADITAEEFGILQRLAPPGQWLPKDAVRALMVLRAGVTLGVERARAVTVKSVEKALEAKLINDGVDYWPDTARWAQDIVTWIELEARAR